MISTWLYFFKESNFGQGLPIENTNEFEPYKLLVPGTTYEVMPVVPIILATTVAMVVVSLMTPKPSEETLGRFFKTKSVG